MRLETVMEPLIGGVKNYDTFIRPLYFFDCMINGSQMDNASPPKITQKHHDILYSLIQNEYDDIDQYILDTFQAFCDRKKRIIINLFYIHRWFAKLRDLITCSNISWSKRNLLSSIIFTLFSNVTEIVIYTPSSDFYLFDLKALLSLMLAAIGEHRKLSIIIRSKLALKKSKTWIKRAYKPSIIEFYAARKWHISLTSQRKVEDIVTIRPMVNFRLDTLEKQGWKTADPEYFNNHIKGRNIIDFYDEENETLASQIYENMRQSEEKSKEINPNVADNEFSPYSIMKHSFQRMKSEPFGIDLEMSDSAQQLIAVTTVTHDSRADRCGILRGKFELFFTHLNL